MDTTASHRWRARRESPAPSAPSTRAIGPSAAGRSQSEVVAPGVEADQPAAQVTQPRQRRGQPTHHAEAQVLHRARRGLGDGGRDVDRPVPWQHHAGRTGTLRRAQEGAEVARIGHAVDGHQERWCTLHRDCRQLVERRLRQRVGLGQHALRRLAARLGEEAPATHFADPDVLGRGQLDDVGQDR